MNLAVTITLWVLAYLVVGIIVTKILTIIEPLPDEGDDMMVLVAIVAWPLIGVIFLGIGVWENIKTFMRWDVQRWRATRKAQQIERDLENREE
jgi:hypothetical protein